MDFTQTTVPKDLPKELKPLQQHQLSTGSSNHRLQMFLDELKNARSIAQLLAAESPEEVIQSIFLVVEQPGSRGVHTASTSMAVGIASPGFAKVQEAAKHFLEVLRQAVLDDVQVIAKAQADASAELAQTVDKLR